MNHERCGCLLALTLTAFLVESGRADFTFAYGNHAYTLVTAAKNWDNAQADAVARGGTLARIDDADENTAILTNLLGRGISATAPDGGGAVYVWIGGKETVEGTYAWTDLAGNATTFWAGGKTGSAQNGLYANWGRNTLGAAGPEPDNWAGTQNRAGFALEPWPRSGSTKIGQAGQWNDINGTDLLTYLVERAPPQAPSNLVISITGTSSLDLAWDDNADNEWGFYVGIREGTSGSFASLTQSALAPDTTDLTGIFGFREGTTYQFLIEAFNDLGVADSAVATVTLPGITSRGYQPATVGQTFAYTVAASTDGGAPSALQVNGALPSGLVYDSGTHQLSGIPTQGGVFELTLSVVYPNWGTLIKPFTLRIIYPPAAPAVTAAIADQTLVPGGPSAHLTLNDYFADRDTEQAVRLVTSKGAVEIALYATATPQTVANFLNYVDRGDYDGSIVHRAVANFIVQGGGFKPAAPDFTRIPTDPSPTNEPGISNRRGLVAMAKLGGDPDSATDQWFVNLNDNAGNLDNQNGGFTAFGRVCGNGMATIDAIAALPRGTYTNTVDGQQIPFQDWPMDTPPPAPGIMDQSKLVLVHSATRIQPLTYAVTGNTAPEVVAAVVQGIDLVLTPANGLGGMASLTLTATDLDGNSVAQTFTVTVASAYTAWLEPFALQGADAWPGADGDGDGLANATEFVLIGSPVASDAQAVLPVGSVVSANSRQYGALTFMLRKERSGAEVDIQAGSELVGGAWTTIWTSADLSGPQVVQQLDQGNHWRLTVRDANPLTLGSSPRFLRLLVRTPQ